MQWLEARHFAKYLTMIQVISYSKVVCQKVWAETQSEHIQFCKQTEMAYKFWNLL